MPTCRLCLYKGDEKQVLSIWDNQIDDLANKIFNCVSINITIYDSLPTSACLSCIHQVTQWAVFKQTCQKSQAILHQNESSGNSEGTSNAILKQCRQSVGNAGVQLDNNCTDHVESNEEVQPEGVQLEGVYECDVCHERFNNCFDYLDHQESHDGSAVFKCDECEEIFNNRIALVKHENNHKIACEHCAKIVLKSSMKLHLIKHTDKYMCKCEERERQSERKKIGEPLIHLELLQEQVEQQQSSM